MGFGNFWEYGVGMVLEIDIVYWEWGVYVLDGKFWVCWVNMLWGLWWRCFMLDDDDMRINIFVLNWFCCFLFKVDDSVYEDYCVFEMGYIFDGIFGIWVFENNVVIIIDLI